MLKIWRTDDGVLYEVSGRTKVEGTWIDLAHPTDQELDQVSSSFSIDRNDLAAALDKEEGSRMELSDDYALILVDVAVPEERHGKKMYTTIPLGIILKDDVIITVCEEPLKILAYFTQNEITKDFSTKKKMRFIYQILLRSALSYQAYAKLLDKRRAKIETRAGNDTDNSELIELHELESTMVYFETSLRTNLAVLGRLMRYEKIKRYPEDKELLDDVAVEFQQAIEMVTIYRNIIDGTRQLLSTILNNRLNNVMKYLTSITIVMAIPMIISGLYGMNLNARGVPFSDSEAGFGIVCAVTFVVCLGVLWLLKKKKML